MNRKNIITMSLVAFLTLPAMAQTDNTFVFTDAQGNELADGDTVVASVYDATKQQIKVPLGIKNISGKKAAGSLTVDLKNMPNGSFTTCAFGNCSANPAQSAAYLDATGNYSESDLNSEWKPVEGSYATWTATLQLQKRAVKTLKMPWGDIDQTGDVEALGRKVYVKFVYADPAGINDIRRNSSDSKVVARYNLNGQRVSSAQQGINVVRLQNGKVIKYLQR